MRKGSFASLGDVAPDAASQLRSDRALVREATIRLALARLAVLVVPFRILRRFLGGAMQESPSDERDCSVPWRVAWAIEESSRRAPWRCKCLEQGIAGKWMLRRRGLDNTLYLGVSRAEGGTEAHAWLRTGAFYVTGATDFSRYTVLSTFADAGRR